MRPSGPAVTRPSATARPAGRQLYNLAPDARSAGHFSAAQLERKATPVPALTFVPFLLWLAKQAGRDDLTGRFARYVQAVERKRCGCFSSTVTLLCHVHAAGPEGAITLLDLALAEWRREVLADARRVRG